MADSIFPRSLTFHVSTKTVNLFYFGLDVPTRTEFAPLRHYHEGAVL